MGYKLYGNILVISWKQTRLPFIVKFYLTHSVNCKNIGRLCPVFNRMHHNDYPIERNSSEVFNFNRNTVIAPEVHKHTQKNVVKVIFLDST